MQNLFTYPLKLEDLSQSVKTYKLHANQQELEFITEIMQVPSVKRFESEIKVKFHTKVAHIHGIGVSAERYHPVDKIACHGMRQAEACRLRNRA